MKVFVAGATGAVGRPLVARLLEAGHDAVGTTRRKDRAVDLRAQGAEPVVADALDADTLATTVPRARPEVVVQQLTALPQAGTAGASDHYGGNSRTARPERDLAGPTTRTLNVTSYRGRNRFHPEERVE